MICIIRMIYRFKGLGSYTPQSTTGESPFCIAYGTEVGILIELNKLKLVNDLIF